MKKFTNYLLMLIILVIFADSTMAKHKSKNNLSELSQGYIRRYAIGIKIKQISSNQVIITSIQNDSPAEKAGLRIGDILKSIEGMPINKRYDILEVCKSKDYNAEIELEIIRKGSIKKFKMKLSKIVDLPKYIEAIQKYIYSDKKMTLVVIATDIKYIGNSSDITISWKERKKKSIPASYESAVMSIFKDDENFTLVDRDKTSEILKEVSLSQSGLTSSSSMNRIGELLNATHILFVDYSRDADPGKTQYFYDCSTRRLIEIQSGRILSSDNVCHKIHKKQ